MLFYVRDRRNVITKKTVDVVQKEIMATNALGPKGYNNLNHGSKEANQNDFLGKKFKDSFSAAAHKDSEKSNSLLNGKMQMEYGKQVNGIAASGCSALKKDHSMENSLKVPAKADLPNGSSISNTTGGDGLLHSASSFRQSNGSLSLGKSLGVDGISHDIAVRHENSDHQDSSTKDEKLQYSGKGNGNQNSGKSLDCLLLKKDHPTETMLEVSPTVGLPIAASISKECVNILSHGNSLGTDNRSHSKPAVNIVMQHESNDHQNSTANGESDSKVVKTTYSVNPNCSGKGPITSNKSSENGVLERSSAETPDMVKNNSWKVINSTSLRMEIVDLLLLLLCLLVYKHSIFLTRLCRMNYSKVSIS